MMSGYFHRVARLSPTRFWINNPTPEEADVAIAAGATGCTCNPSYCQKMIDHPAGDRGSLELLDQAVKKSDNDSQAQAILQRKLAKPILDRFRPLYERNPGRDGMVSLQGDLVVTINWLGTADKLIESDPPVVHRLFNPVPPQVIEELLDKLPDFRRGYVEDGLTVEEYENFGPVELFRSHFVWSWERVLSLAAERRAALAKSF
jgi:hypothetical protein